MKDNNERLLKRFVEGKKKLMEDSKREILNANKEDIAKNFDRMGKRLGEELKEDLHKYMGQHPIP